MKKALVVYWSGTGNTEAMANAVAKGIKDAGLQVDIEHVSSQPDVKAYDRVAFGCPAMGAEVLEESEFDPYFMGIEGDLANKKIALFGSYGWGSGEWMISWEERVEADNANLYDKGLMINNAPDDAGLAECEAFGAGFAKY